MSRSARHLALELDNYPGYSDDRYERGIADELIAQYPNREREIRNLTRE